MNSYPTISHGWFGFQGAPFVKPKKAKVKGSPGNDLIKIHRSASLENIFMYTYIYIHMWPYVCVFVFNHIQLHLICSITLLECNEYVLNALKSDHESSLEGHKKQDQEQVLKAQRVYVTVIPAGFWWFYTYFACHSSEWFLLIMVLLILYLFCYFVILLFRNSE